MGKKKNKFDFTPEELLEELGEESDYLDEDYHKSGEKCMEFLELVDPNLSKDDKTHICTRILDNQKRNERFSETLNRLGI